MQPDSIQPEPNRPYQPPNRIRHLGSAWWIGAGFLLACLVWSGCSGNKSETEPGPTVDGQPDATLPAAKSDTNFDQLANVESFEQAASAQLKKITEWIESSRQDPSLLKSISAADYRSAEFDSGQLVTLRDAGFNVQKMNPTPDTSDDSSQPALTAYASSLETTWRQLLTPMGDPAERKPIEQRAKFKVTQVQLEGNSAQTIVIVSVFAKFDNDTSTEVNCTLDVQWNQGADGAKPLIRAIAVNDYETARFDGTSGVTFTDRTRDLINDNPDLVEQFSHGTEYWTSRLMLGDYAGHFGLAVGDINGDQRDDIYICQPAGLPNRLLVQQEDGRIEDQSSEANLDILDQTRSALFVDLDNDGDQDLLVAAASFLLVFENEGKTELKLRDKLFEARSAYSLSAADFDNDGDVDIYACGYSALFGAGPFPFAYPFHDANNGGRNVLYENDGQGNLRDITDSVGLDQNNSRFSMAAAWEDFDLDGDLDLYVANDFGRNSLYQNQDGQFQNVAEQQDVEDQSFGMSVDWSDVNRDGRPDLYVSNMFSSAGNRVSFQSGYMSRQPELQSRVQYMARGNSLFLGAPEAFTDASIESNVWMGRWAWGSKFVDLDNDSWDDVVVANGYLTRQAAKDL